MRVVVVTGASSGIGLACAEHLAARGWRVFGASRTPPSEQVPFEYVPLDVGSEASVAHAIGVIYERTGRIDAVVNNAGLGYAGAIEDTSLEEAQRQFDTNFFGALRVLRAALPHLRSSRGRIVQMSSIGGLISLPYQGLYCASKFALEGLSEALAHELHADGVRVSLVEPGDFRTGFTDHRRVVRGAGEGSLHRAQFETALARFVADEQGGPDPRVVARVVHRALSARRPALRYVVGVPLQRWAVTLKKLLPWRLFAWVLRRMYGLR